MGRGTRARTGTWGEGEGEVFPASFAWAGEFVKLNSLFTVPHLFAVGWWLLPSLKLRPGRIR